MLSAALTGHTVVAAHRSDTAERAMPPWSPVEASVDVVCRLHQRINDVYDVNLIDVVVVGIFHQVRAPNLFALLPGPRNLQLLGVPEHLGHPSIL